MSRRLALVALWAVFAVASVGVGFAAAGLVGDPFADPRTTGVSASLPEATGRPVATAHQSSPAAPQHDQPRKHRRTSTAHSGTARPTPHATHTSPRTATPRASTADPQHTAAPETSVRSITTRGGLVSGSCRGGLVSVNASPSVGWSIETVSGGRVQEAEVKFRRTGGGEGEVEVHAVCSNGAPHFAVSDGGGSGPGGRDE